MLSGANAERLAIQSCDALRGVYTERSERAPGDSRIVILSGAFFAERRISFSENEMLRRIIHSSA